MKKEVKDTIIVELGEQLKAFPHFYLVDLTGLDAAKTSDLRRKCFKSEIKLLVVKNTLLHKAFEASEIDFKVDKAGIVHTSIGKISFSADQIFENAKEFVATIIKLKPAAAKGTYIKSIFLSSTMSMGIKVDPKSVE